MIAPQTIDDLPTPAILVDEERLERNILGMQRACDAAGVELRPHIKTHKLVPVAARQLAAGARGLTCAKLGEAEAMLASGAREVFVAHSLVDPRQARRVARLADSLDDFRVAATGAEQTLALEKLAEKAGRKLPVMMAVDTGLGREGVRDAAGAERLASLIARCAHLELRGFYTHEGWFYGAPFSADDARLEAMLESLCAIRDTIDPGLPLWPGCSVTAHAIAARSAGRVRAVRPGAYVFGDLALSLVTGVMCPDAIALHVLATVVDKPAPGLALIDAGSKTFSSDRTPSGLFALPADGRDIAVSRVNEEHGYASGAGADALRVGERVAFVPAHVCTVVNLADEVMVVRRHEIAARWRVDARGRSQ
ncbi:MAG: alanine racemase [Opitutaceae bacterium]|jgi:D-serine deaminase-like pyridoxal phosphate-dependent protein|nr:alanine racemase [Opitutaceae bacterium]